MDYSGCPFFAIWPNISSDAMPGCPIFIAYPKKNDIVLGPMAHICRSLIMDKDWN